MRNLNSKNSIGLFIVVMGSLLILSSCEKTFDDKTPANLGFDKGSNFQLVIASIGTLRTNIYVDGATQNGAGLIFGNVFPRGTGTYGFSVPAGVRSFLIRDTLSTSAQPQISFSNVVGINKNYTIFTYDTFTAIKQKTVETDIVIPTDTSCRIRLAHFAYSPVQMPNIDLYSFRRASNVISNLPYTEVTNFIPFASRLIDTLQVREAGTTTVLAQLNGFSPLEKRSYTLLYRGRHRVPNSTSVFTSRTLTSFLNY